MGRLRLFMYACSMAITDPDKQALELKETQAQLAEARAELRAKRGAGGTPGGLGTFFLGLALTIAGLYLVLTQVTVTTWFGGNWFGTGYRGGIGIVMLPLLIGIGALFFNGKSKAGWILTALGGLAILAEIITSLSFHFRETSLLAVIMMFGMLAAGLGLIFRSLRAYE